MNLTHVTLHLSTVNMLSISAHGSERADRAGSDLWLRVGPFVLGVPHGWRPFEALRDMAEEHRRLRESLEVERLKSSRAVRAGVRVGRPCPVCELEGCTLHEIGARS